MTDDAELLRRYVDHKSEEAFGELVRRQIDFVYGAALRQVRGNGALAQDVAQVVFTDLARKAAMLARHEVIVGWLHTATRFAAAKAIRTEVRRSAREKEAQLFMNHAAEETEAAVEWERLHPVLDAVLGELKERERAAILLRFFEKKPLAEVGEKLSLTETAARSCVDRALEKMRGLLARRGVTSTAAAPVGLAASVAGLAMAGAAAGGLGTLGILTFMSTSKIAVGVVAVCACVGFAVFDGKALRATRAEVAAAGQRQNDLNTKLRELEGKLAAQTKRATDAEDDLAKLLAAGGKVQAAQAAAAAAPITQAVVEARYKRGKQLAQNGQWEEALKEFLWCFDEGMPRILSYGGVRTSFLLSEIERIKPVGIAALRERRNRIQERIIGGAMQDSDLSDFVAINSTLGETQMTLAVFDQLLPADHRRQSLAELAGEVLLENRGITTSSPDNLMRRWSTSSNGQNSTRERSVQDRCRKNFGRIYENLRSPQPRRTSRRSPVRVIWLTPGGSPIGCSPTTARRRRGR